MDLPINKKLFFHSYVKLPEGNLQCFLFGFKSLVHPETCGPILLRSILRKWSSVGNIIPYSLNIRDSSENTNTLSNIATSIEHGPVEIVDVAYKMVDLSIVFCKRLPEGTLW